MGNISGASKRIAGRPSSRQPKIKNTIIVTAMKPIQPPGSVVMKVASCCATPDCAMTHAMLSAQPRIIKIAPVSAAVSTSISYSFFKLKPPYKKMPASMAYSTASVDTSVAVATPPPTAPRIKNGSSRAGPAIMKVRRMVMNGARLTPSVCSCRAFQRANAASATSSTMATTTPLLKRPAIDTPATEPNTISTMLGGTVSAMAAPVASSAIISRGLWPRRFISGNKAGATVAMSDTLEPEMPDTINSEPNST